MVVVGSDCTLAGVQTLDCSHYHKLDYIGHSSVAAHLGEIAHIAVVGGGCSIDCIAVRDRRLHAVDIVVLDEKTLRRAGR